MIDQHESIGATSDVAWALAFCIENGVSLGKKAAKVLSRADEACVVLQALHLNSLGLLPSGLKTARISKKLKDVDMDSEDWLLGYEALRQGFLQDSQTSVRSNSLFADLLSQQVTFYRTRLPRYSTVIHPGSAPEWVVKAWLKALRSEEEASEEELKKRPRMLELIDDHLGRVEQSSHSDEETVLDLLDVYEPDEFESLLEDEEPYMAPSSPDVD